MEFSSELREDVLAGDRHALGPPVEAACSAGYHATSGEIVLSGVHRCSGQLRYSWLQIIYFPAPEHDLRATYDCAGTATHVHIGG